MDFHHPPRFPRGFRCASRNVGLKPEARDLTLFVSDVEASAAALFTRSHFPGAPIVLGRETIREGRLRAIVANSKCSNVATGETGLENARRMAAAAAAEVGTDANRILVSSTGVIGVQLPIDRIERGIVGMTAELRDDPLLGAEGIMTTDSHPKALSCQVGDATLTWVAKGSGMIEPNMATMLVYIFTDAKIGAGQLQKILSRNVDDTFNSITVDSDTSTSDTLLVAATGQSAAAEVKGPVLKAFETALRGVMRDLALQVVRDGEGATKLVEVRVTGAASDEDAAKVAFAIANSPLVKTAVAGQDPNWGRIVAAVGKSGAQADRDRLTIRFGDILVARDGWRNPDYREEDGVAYMQGPELVFAVDLGLGKARRSVWTCDLTARYVEINADYRS